MALCFLLYGNAALDQGAVGFSHSLQYVAMFCYSFLGIGKSSQGLSLSTSVSHLTSYTTTLQGPRIKPRSLNVQIPTQTGFLGEGNISEPQKEHFEVT